MQVRDLSHPKTSKTLNESMAKTFGYKLNLDTFTLEQLCVARDRTLEKIATLNYSSVNIQNSCNFAKQVNLPLNIGGLTACILLDCGCNVYNADIFPIICRSVGFTLIHQKAIHKKIKFSSSYDILQRYNQSNHI